MNRRSVRKLLGSLAGAAVLVALAATFGRDGRSGSVGRLGDAVADHEALEPSSPALNRAGIAVPTGSGTLRQPGETEGPRSVRVLHAPGGRFGLDPLIVGLSDAFGLARPSHTHAAVDLGQVVGTLGLDQLGGLTRGLLSVAVDDAGLVLSFDSGVITRTWDRFVGTIAEWWRSGVRHAAEVQGQASQWAMTWFDGNRPVAPPSDEEIPRRAVLLVQGVDGPGQAWRGATLLGSGALSGAAGVWDDLIPALCEAGQMAVQFEYSGQAPLAASADALGEALLALRAHGVEEVDFVAHAAGGLVVRDVLTRAEWYAGDGEGGSALPRVRRAILVAPPNHGAAFARRAAMREAESALGPAAARAANPPVAAGRQRPAGPEARVLRDEVRLEIQRAMGGAMHDLRPGSAYLSDLNARPLPEDVQMTIIAGRLLNRDAGLSAPAAELAAEMAAEAASDAAQGEARRARAAAMETWLGDGLISLESAILPGVRDVVVLPGNHRSLLVKRRGDHAPPAIPVIVDRLAEGWR